MRKINLFILTLVCIFATACCTSKNASSTSDAEKIEFVRDEVWQLTAMQGSEVKYSEEQDPVTIQINTEAQTLNGNAGCNNYFGDFTMTTEKNNAGTIKFDHVGATRMACPEQMMRLEDKFLPLLNRVDRYQLTDSKLTLLQGEKALLEFEKQ